MLLNNTTKSEPQIETQTRTQNESQIEIETHVETQIGTVNGTVNSTANGTNLGNINKTKNLKLDTEENISDCQKSHRCEERER